MPIHDAEVDAVHAQPAAVVTATGGAGPPPAPSECAVGAMVYEQLGAGAAAWLTVSTWPPIESVPVLAAPVLTSTEKDTVPFPTPVAAPVIVIHATPLVAVHPQAAGLDTVIVVPAPPAASIA
jgi:hypothetical protein